MNGAARRRVMVMGLTGGLVLVLGSGRGTLAPWPGAGVAQATGRLHPGDRAPAFTLKTVDKGEARTLDRLAKEGPTRGLVMVFVSSKCPYVAQARQPLGALFRSYAGKVAFVGVNANQNESADEVRADAAASFPFPLLRDEGAKVADLYGADRTPEAFLIDAGGVVRYHGGVADLGAALADFTA